MTRAFALAAAVLAVGCYKNIDQHANTGEDGWYDGADLLQLDPKTDSVEVEDTVSYPGGDRVDWTAVELTKGKKGIATIDLKWTSPRAGGDLSFIVYDQYGRKVASVKPKTKRTKRKRGSKSVSIADVAGTLYIEVYASNRSDAGDYELVVSFEATHVNKPGELSVPMPPRLAAIYPPCDLKAIDPSNPDCQGKTAPAVVVPCDPKALDRDNPECLPYYPECDPKKIDATNPKCDGVTPVAPDPIVLAAVITDQEPSGTGTKITINVGTKDGVEKGWTGYIVDASSGKKATPLENGTFTIETVKSEASYGKVKAGPTIVKKNLSVRLSPPVTPP
jgi:hypothetical protein